MAKKESGEEASGGDKRMKEDTSFEAINPTDATRSENGTSEPVESREQMPDMEPFGNWLKEHRITRKISLEEIAAVTKVHILQLRALEENDIAKLPAPAFVRGFLVSYARHLNIDENEVLERYKAAFGTLTPLTDLLMPTSNRAAKSSSFPKVRMVSSPNIRQAPSAKQMEHGTPSFLNFRNTVFLLTFLGLTILVASLISLGKRAKTAAPVVAETSETPAHPSVESPTTVGPVNGPNQEAKTQNSPGTGALSKALLPGKPAKGNEAELAKAATEAKNKAPIPEAAHFNAEIKALEQSWVHVRIDDGDAKGMALKGGASYPFQAQRRITFSFSDAGSIEIRWNGKWYAAPGSRGDVKTLTLPEQLASLSPKAVVTARAPKTIKPRGPKTPDGTPAAAGAPPDTAAPAAPTTAAPENDLD